LIVVPQKETSAVHSHVLFFLDSSGYYLKTATNSFLHQFHARRDHIRTSTTLLDADLNQIQGNLSSARAKTGVAANLHYVRSGRQGTKSILSHTQIKALLKKNPHQVDGNDADKSMNGSGEIGDIYQFLEKPGSHYVSLLARVVPEASDPSFSDSPSIADSPCQPTQIDSPPKTVLFNETRLGHTKDQEDIVMQKMKNKACFAWYQTIDGYYPSLTPRR
jgi:hypothetical protein